MSGSRRLNSTTIESSFQGNHRGKRNTLKEFEMMFYRDDDECNQSYS